MQDDRTGSTAGLILLARQSFWRTRCESTAKARGRPGSVFQQSLKVPSTAVVLISSFDAAKIQEAEAFHDELSGAGYHLQIVIVNRAWPDWTPPDAAAQSVVRKALRASGETALAEIHGALSDYYAARRLMHTRFGNLVTVPEMTDDVVGLEAPAQLAQRRVPSA